MLKQFQFQLSLWELSQLRLVVLYAFKLQSLLRGLFSLLVKDCHVMDTRVWEERENCVILFRSLHPILCCFQAF